MADVGKRGPDYLRLRYQERRHAMGSRAALISAIAVAVGLVLAWIQDSQRGSTEDAAEATDSLSQENGATSIWTARNRSSMTIQDCPTCPTMIRIPGGRFPMGLRYETYSLLNIPAGQAALELPLHWVDVVPFSIGLTEITRNNFAEYATAVDLGTGDCDTSAGTENKPGKGKAGWLQPGFEQSDTHPVVCVSWHEASAYANWLSDKTGQTYRLPTEAEWEWSARAGTHGPWFWGADQERACNYINGSGRDASQPSQNANFACDDGMPFTAAADTAQTNPAGLHHIIGNAAEWTQDCMTTGYDTDEQDNHVADPEACPEKVVRGGSWSDGPASARASAREPRSTDYRSNRLGFRLVREIGP